MFLIFCNIKNKIKHTSHTQNACGEASVCMYIYIYIYLKIWISRKESYFIGILNGIGDIFLPDYFQVFLLLNIRFRSIFEL